MPAKWRWFLLPSYDLESEDLVKYLKNLFGNYEFHLKVPFIYLEQSFSKSD